MVLLSEYDDDNNKIIDTKRIRTTTTERIWFGSKRDDVRKCMMVGTQSGSVFATTRVGRVK